MDEQAPKPVPPRITDVKPPEPTRSSTTADGVVEAPAEQTVHADPVAKTAKSAAPVPPKAAAPRSVPLLAICVAIFCFVALSIVAFMAYTHGA